MRAVIFFVLSLVPGIDPPSLDKEENSFGWLSQDTELLPKRVIPAAVLVPLINRGDGVTILLTQRPRHLKSHPGQVSFPGGKKEPCDETAEDTALRETEEEIGLPREKLILLGGLGNAQQGVALKLRRLWVLLSLR